VPPRETPLFPYTTLFRSVVVRGADPWRHRPGARPGVIGEPGLRPGQRPAGNRVVPGLLHAARGQFLRLRARREFDADRPEPAGRSEEHTSELQSPYDLVC